MKNIDITGSIIITLGLMLICYIFNLSFFSSILLMIFCFLALNYRGRIKGNFYTLIGHFRGHKVFKNKKVEIKSSYERMEIDE